MNFEINQEFILNGKPVKLISGALHYFRIVPEYWEDRIIKLKAMGCNTVETYVAWNFHERYENIFTFTGMANLRKFLQLCQKHDLLVILRLSPYICAEWEFGGIPGWVLKYDDLKIRQNNPRFLELVNRFYAQVMKQIFDLQCTQGGNIIMMQVENEYGSFSNDQEYLKSIKKIMIQKGVEVELFTADGPWDNLLENGSLKGIFPTGNFGSRAGERFNFLKQYTKNQYPLMCMEFWDGWFDVWGDEKHHVREPQECGQELDNILKLGSVNLYMFHGGTNFGFFNGSNFKGSLLPRVTSYDYDAPLTEWGEKGLKYDVFKKVISQYLPEIPKEVDFQNDKLNKIVSNPVIYGLLDNLKQLCQPKMNYSTLTMEKLGQSLGYILYECNYQSLLKIESSLKLWGANDRAHIFHNDKLIKILENDELSNEVNFCLNKGENNFKILLENLGRVNYGPKMMSQKKGIEIGVELNHTFLSNWMHYCLELNNLDKLKNQNVLKKEPKFYDFRFQLTSSEIKDTFIETEDYGKGNIFINGFNLGRYWKKGPQKNLYLPKHLFQKGENSIVIFETENVEIKKVKFSQYPSL